LEELIRRDKVTKAPSWQLLLFEGMYKDQKKLPFTWLQFHDSKFQMEIQQK
jgi:hypothetical protein